MNLGKIITNNFLAKIISLALAVATWFYVFDLVNSDSFSQKKETAEDVFSRYKFIVKDVPVKPVFSGKSPAGYRVLFDKIIVEPQKISVFGPKEIISQVEDLQTDKINLGEYTRSIRLNLGINSDVKFLRLPDKVVDVYIPIELINKDSVEENNDNEEKAVIQT
ncbi:MAG: YbbR-like domain-containing protein [Candidatus Omnitrophica bacterium]|nr:YbbR-like domain-containing protein [Candidatus Omnitrophota bacterium]